LVTATDPATRAAFRRHRDRRDRYRASITHQLQRLGYRPRTWPEAERVARRLTRRH